MIVTKMFAVCTGCGVSKKTGASLVSKVSAMLLNSCLEQFTDVIEDACVFAVLLKTQRKQSNLIHQQHLLSLSQVRAQQLSRDVVGCRSRMHGLRSAAHSQRQHTHQIFEIEARHDLSLAALDIFSSTKAIRRYRKTPAWGYPECRGNGLLLSKSRGGYRSSAGLQIICGVHILRRLSFP